MKGEVIPDNNHITRFCQPKHTFDGQIQASAFMLRKGEESLSVNWLEILSCSSRESEINKIRSIYSSIFTVKPNAKIAVLNVGEIRNNVKTESSDRRNLEILHNPSNTDPSHSGIYNLNQDEVLIAELILETLLESYSAV